MQNAWQWLDAVLAWFFPATLLADPLVVLLVHAVEFVFGFWFLGLILFRPIYLFLRWFAQLIKRI